MIQIQTTAGRSRAGVFAPSSGSPARRPVPKAGRTFKGIRTSVSDGTSTTTLPSFGIHRPHATGTSTEKPERGALVLNVTPKTTATIGPNYWFKPAAIDSNGDVFRFSVPGKPAWLSFSAGNGSLWGSPGTANVGTTSLITIAVSDGKTTTRLEAFTQARCDR